MSLFYYSRARVIIDLLPLLRASSLPAHVVSIYHAGLEGNFIPDDISLRSPENYTFLNRRSHNIHLTNLFAEALVQQNPGKLSFVHVYPGLVMTTLFENSSLPGWVKVLMTLLWPLLRFMSQSDEENGQRMLYLSTTNFPSSGGQESNTTAIGSNGQRGSGVYAVDPKSRTVPVLKMDQKYAGLRAEGMVQKVYDHTMKAFEEAVAGRKFRD